MHDYTSYLANICRPVLTKATMLAVLTLASLCLLAACSDGSSSQPPTSNITPAISWPAKEEAVYRLLDGDDRIGTAILSTTIDEEIIRMAFDFDFPDHGFRDKVVTVASSKTIKPISVTRTLSGPEGDREWDVIYSDNTATVTQRSEDDERVDTLTLPANAYDSWTDLLIWRAMELREGIRVAYNDVATAIFQPGWETVTVSVEDLAQVNVPAGTFTAWQLELQTNGPTHTAWYAATETKPLVLYDNGDILFQLEELRY